MPFYKSLNIPLHPLGDILHIEGATGHRLPYHGYIECTLSIPDLNIVNSTGLFLVVDETPFSKRVPIIIGTNVMTPLRKQTNQRLTYNNPWNMAFQCLALQDRQLSKNDGRLAVIKSACSNNILIPSNKSVSIPGIIDRKIKIHCTALMQSTSDSKLPTGVEISPVIVDFNGDEDLSVLISNRTNSPVTISPKAIICELQWCSLHTQNDSDACASYDHVTNHTDFVSGFDLTEADMTSDQTDMMRSLLMRYPAIFSRSDTDLGYTNMVKHRIELMDEIPFKQRHRRIPPAMYQELKVHLQQLLDQQVIRKSHSPWCSNIVMARKKDNSLRLCIDFRQLNNRTIKDAYALPRFEETLDHLSGSKYFSVLDMRSGYHQVELAEEHKARTAFSVGSLGMYEYNRMPFGLSNSPATYQRLMEECFASLINKECVIFLDDILIFSDTFDEHLYRLEHVFQKVTESGMKLSPKKCHFCQPKVKYLGHIISSKGIETDPEKIDKVKNWLQPKDVEETRKFVSFASYYRRFVNNFAGIAKPLTDLLCGISNKKKGKKIKQVVPWKWGNEQQQAFDKLKEALVTPPILAYANYSLPFEIHIDASGYALGAILYQEQDGKKRVISYASRGLKVAERNYPAHKREFLALKWAICEKFHEYLYGSSFTVYTDNNPLTYVTTTAKLDAAGHRWLATLSAYNFTIKYKAGKHNIDADILSRLPEYKEISESSIHALSKAAITPYVTTVCMSLPCSSDLVTYDDDDGDVASNTRLWRVRQREDSVISQFVTHVTNKTKPKYDILCSEGKLIFKEFKRLTIKRGILYRLVKQHGNDLYQLVLPSKYRQFAIKGSHDEMGHPGVDRTMSVLRDRCYWPKMSKDVDSWITKCERCIMRKSSTSTRAPMVNIKTTEPFEIVCMDYLTLETSKGGFQHILVITDHFTKYALAIPTKNQSAKTTASALFNELIVHYGFPSRLHSDQGANFQSELIAELCQLSGMAKSRTSPYRPSGNGACERFNRTLLGMLGTLEHGNKLDWKSHVGSLVHAYNSTRHETTGYTPYELMFGRKPRLALDVMLGIVSEGESTTYCD